MGEFIALDHGGGGGIISAVHGTFAQYYSPVLKSMPGLNGAGAGGDHILSGIDPSSSRTLLHALPSTHSLGLAFGR